MKPCVLIPTFDNPRTLKAVVEGALSSCPDVIVVDDGSRQPAAEIVGDLPTVVVHRHERNLGKGAALRTGLRLALEMGFTHVVTIDSDGQHLPDEISLLLEAARNEPTALVLGARDLKKAGAGPGSRFGCRFSNFWTFVETGLRIPDTQTGFRCYPLAKVEALRLTTTGFDFELEVLVKAAWASVPLVSVPVNVRYFQGEERVSHLRPVVDFLRIGRLHTSFVTSRICLPAPYLAVRSERWFHDMPWYRRWRETFVELFVREPGSPGRIALSVALGLFMGLAPVWGFQVALTLVFAHWSGLSKPVAVVSAHISFPLVIPFILYLSLVLGRFALREPADPRPLSSLELAPADLPAWVVGSFILAALAAAVGGTLTYLLVTAARRLRRGRLPG